MSDFLLAAAFSIFLERHAGRQRVLLSWHDSAFLCSVAAVPACRLLQSPPRKTTNFSMHQKGGARLVRRPYAQVMSHKLAHPCAGTRVEHWSTRVSGSSDRLVRSSCTGGHPPTFMPTDSPAGTNHGLAPCRARPSNVR